MKTTNRPTFPKGTIILVCDGAKALFFENTGDEKALSLVPLEVHDQPHPPTREMGADRPTRVFASHDGSRSGAEQTDWHSEAEIEFLQEAAETLEALVSRKGPSRTVIAAPPRAMGVLRSAFGPATRKTRLVELAKDLVKHTTGDIERHIADLGALK